MTRIISVFFILIFVVSGNSWSAESSLPKIDLKNAWFKPGLAVNNEPGSCKTFLDAYTGFYMGDPAGNSLLEYSNEHEGFIGAITTNNPDFTVLVEGAFPFSVGLYSDYALRETPPTSQKYFSLLSIRQGSSFTRSGNAYSFVILDKSLSQHHLTDESYESFIDGHTIDSILKMTDEGSDYQILYKNEKEPELYSKKIHLDIRSLFGYKNNFYLAASEGNESLMVFSLKDEKTLNLACEITTAPYEGEVQQEMKKFPEFSSYQDAMRKMMAGGDDCAINSYAAYRMEGLFLDALYRPWVNLGVGQRPDSNLERWGYSGVWNYHVYQDYKKSQQLATKELQQFYIKSYGVNNQDASLLAKSAVSAPLSTFYYADFQPETAIDIGYYNKPAGFYDIARMILDDASIADLKIKLQAIDQDIIKRGDFLFYSAERPDVTALLLSMDANPNAANTGSYSGFGKTPLMYSAQYNQPETAKALLKHGANPNAVTVQSRSCGIHTFNMTPLHYAVRYASPSFIKLLLDHGAQSFLEAKDKEDRPEEQGETPLDWLQRYTNARASEKNPNIPDNEVAKIESWLQASSTDDLSSRATEYILQAEKEYQEGKVSDAYKSISLALQIEPNNEKALGDMSLIALKKGSLGESLEASSKLINSSKDNKIKASAWFNQGIACEANKLPSQQDSRVFYNGKRYCDYGIIHPLLMSLIAEETTARKNKMLAVFGSGAVPFCEIPYLEKTIKIHFEYHNAYETETGSGPRSSSEMQTLYILHEPDVKIEARDFAWGNYTYSIPGDSTSPRKYNLEPTLAGAYPLDNKTTLTVLKSPQYLQFPFQLGDYACAAQH